MNKIACDTVMDLIPLVKDKVGSQASEKLVEEHIETCHDCRELYNSFETVESEDIVMDEKKVISKMKKQIFITSIIAIAIFAIVGLVLADTVGIFYNILIMPLIGVIGYFTFSKKSEIILISLFIFSYIWLLIKYIAEGMISEGLIIDLITVPIFWSLVYVGLAGLGIIIGYLLKYAFGKENNYEEY